MNNEIIDMNGNENTAQENENYAAPDLRDFILSHADTNLGPAIVNYNDQRMKSLSKKAATICRRRFRADDVLLLSLLDEDEEGDAGVAFTNDGIYHWEEEDNFIFGIKYRDIKYVDYDSNGVRVKAEWDVTDPLRSIKATSHAGGRLLGGLPENARTIPCTGYEQDVDEDDEQEYIREMYNFIADIVDELNDK